MQAATTSMPMTRRPLAQIELRLEEIASSAPAIAGHGCATLAGELVALGEEVLEHWVVARGEAPTHETREGFRLLALHRQGARGEPSFNACRETARELVYHYNLVIQEPEHPEATKRVQLAAMVAKHLALFVAGKMEVEGLGEFCCAAKPVRANGE